IDPATEEVSGRIGTASEDDVNAAVAAARAAFDAWAETTPAERAEFVDRIVVEYDARIDDMVEAITREMGAPLSFARNVQTKMARERFVMAAKLVRDFSFEQVVGTSLVVREPVGVCAFITPWNWPLNQA